MDEVSDPFDDMFDGKQWAKEMHDEEIDYNT